jgi:hypothetical protein
MKAVLGFIISLFGLVVVVSGEITALAWSIFDFANLFKGDDVTFLACLWLIFLYFIRGLFICLVGIVIMGLGFAIAGAKNPPRKIIEVS